MTRTASVRRTTAETNIDLALCIDGKGQYDIRTGIGFFDHMLEQLTRHGRFDLRLVCEGDLQVDGHHTVEDVGIALGGALAEALGEKRGVVRYGSCLLPMDEALVQVALDLSGRACLVCDLEPGAARIGELDTQLVREFLLGFTRAAGVTLHVRQLAGFSAHHIVEALFKGLGRSLREAVRREEPFLSEIPSTKGVL